MFLLFYILDIGKLFKHFCREYTVSETNNNMHENNYYTSVFLSYTLAENV